MTTEQDTRGAFIAGLRKLADGMEADPAIRPLYDGGSSVAMHFTHDRAELLAYARLMDDRKVDIDANARHYDYRITGRIGGIRVELCAKSEEVTQRRVIGTKVTPIFATDDLDAELAEVAP